MQDDFTHTGPWQLGGGPYDMAQLVSDHDQQRARQQTLLEEIAVAEQAVKALPEVQKLQALRQESATVTEKLNSLENLIRYNAVLLYMNANEKHPHPRIEVQEVNAPVEYKLDDAILWCAENRQYDLLKLNKKLFEKYIIAHCPQRFPLQIVPRVVMNL